MKSQGLLVIVFIAVGSVSCHYLNEMMDEFKRNRYDKSDEHNEIENNENNEVESDEDNDIESDSKNSHNIATVNGKLKKKPVGQRKGDHLDHEDIMFRKGEEEALFGTKSSSDEGPSERLEDATIYTNKRWTLPVPYQIEGSLGSAARSAISSAIAEYKLKTCITFRPKRSGDTSYLSFFRGDGCWSYVGRSGGKQLVSLGSGCEYRMTAIHEIMHALGFWHEQSRPDRDNYVQIFLHNVQQGEAHNFDKKLARDITTFGFPYDYRSVMHYTKFTFGKFFNGRQQQTIAARNNPSQQLGQCFTCGMSQTDVNQLNAMYCRGTPQTGINRNTVISQMSNLLARNAGQSNDNLRNTVLNFMKSTYKDYNFLVNAYNAISTHYYYGECGHIFNSHNKNLVVCYAKKSSRVPSLSTQSRIVSAALASITNKNCDPKWAANEARNKATSYGYPIAGVQVVRFGASLRSAWSGPGYFRNYKCFNNNDSSFVMMFG